MIDDTPMHPMHPMDQCAYQERCKRTLDKKDALVLSDFLTLDKVEPVTQWGEHNQYPADYTVNDHTVDLQASDPDIALSESARMTIYGRLG